MCGVILAACRLRRGRARGAIARAASRRGIAGPSPSAAAAAVLLIGFSIVVSIQAARIAAERDAAARERDTAEEVSDFLVQLFEVSDPGEARGNSVTARELLDCGAGRIERELAANLRCNRA